MATATVTRDSVKSAKRAGGREHAFFFGLAFLVLTAVFAGFARTYFLAGMFRAKLPSLIVHVHGVVFTLWIALLLVQVALLASRRPRWHMRLGVLGMFLAPLMVITGFATLISGIKRGFAPPPILQIITSIDTLILCCFAGLVSWAFLARRDSPTHKRLIMFATFLIIAPAIARWPITTPSRFWVFMYCFPALLVAYDLWTRRSIHRATVCGLVLVIGLQLANPPLARSAFLNQIVARLQKS
jgi:hypothetical protein